MAQNKLKLKVEMLTKTVKQLIEDFIKLDSMTRGTLTAFQLHIGKPVAVLAHSVHPNISAIFVYCRFFGFPVHTTWP